MIGGLRLVAAALVGAGLLFGQAGGAVPPPREVRHDGSVVLAVDFHVHSFPGDGGLPPWSLAQEARRRGLDAIALTNHNLQLSWTLQRLLPWTPSGALLIPGVELTSTWYHMAAVGVLGSPSWQQSVASAAGDVHARGGAAIAAHPVGREAAGYDDAGLDSIDGVEAAHPLTQVDAKGRAELRAFYERARARRPAIAAIGSTDFHFFAPVGFCRTYVFARERSIDAILEAVRRGRTVACDANGDVTGPPELTAAVAGVCRGAAAPSTSRAADTGSRALVWIGLVALVALGMES